MTTIVHRDGQFGADTQVTCADGSKSVLHKIKRLDDGSVFACAGATSAIMKVERWMLAGMSRTHRPKIGRNTEVDCIWVHTDGSRWLLNDVFEFEPNHNPFFAIGSGAAWAMGAMDQGARVRAALKTAAKYDSNTGAPFDIFRVGPQA